jgi:hypothetical protein
MRYQWRFNGNVIPGATNAALILERVRTNQAGFYHVSVSNSVGFDISARAQISLLPMPSCTDAPDGLISWWPGDANPFDTMALNNVAIFSPSSFATGKVAQAFAFSGLGNRITINSSPSLNFSSNANFSIEMWIKTSGSNLSGGSASYPNVPLFEKRTTGTFNWSGYSLSLNQGRLAFALGSGAGAPILSNYISIGPDLRDAMFHHVAVTVNRSTTNGGTLYVDGTPVLNFNPLPHRNNGLITTSPLYIGAPTVTFSNSYFNGLIDEPAIYNRALTSDEILAVRQAGAAGKCKIRPTILMQPVSQRITSGSNAVLSVTAAGTPLLRYQWLRNNALIPGATNPTYLASLAATYSVRVTNAFGLALSSNAALLVSGRYGHNVQTRLYRSRHLGRFGSRQRSIDLHHRRPADQRHAHRDHLQSHLYSDGEQHRRGHVRLQTQ